MDRHWLSHFDGNAVPAQNDLDRSPLIAFYELTRACDLVYTHCRAAATSARGTCANTGASAAAAGRVLSPSREIRIPKSRTALILPRRRRRPGVWTAKPAAGRRR